LEIWYYVGNFGQLGPLQREDMEELIECGAIGRDTYVWRDGMAEWRTAGSVEEFGSFFGSSATRPPGNSLPPPPPPAIPTQPLVSPHGFNSDVLEHIGPSSKNRVVAGVLNLLLPGVGRMYLGHVGVGICQLFLCLCTGGLGHLWSLIDGIVMLAGGKLRDGEGRLVRK
jgi:hypothetical protein